MGQPWDRIGTERENDKKEKKEKNSNNAQEHSNAPLHPNVQKFIEKSREHGFDFERTLILEWFELYSDDRIIRNYKLMRARKNIQCPQEWFNSALREDYASGQGNIQINQEFAANFKFSHAWNDLDIKPKKYCKHIPTNTEYYYTIDTKTFENKMRDLYDSFVEERKCS